MRKTSRQSFKIWKLFEFVHSKNKLLNITAIKCVLTYFFNGLREIGVCGKTGTAEHGEGEPSHVLFTGFAPAEEPEIAIAVVAEKGDHGADLAPVARQVLDYYFNFQRSTQQTEMELTLLH